MSRTGPGAGLLEIVRAAFLPEPPERLGVAVSGGGDSMALLHLLARLAPETGWALAAVTVDHGLRPEAAGEAEFAAAAAARLGVAHEVLRWRHGEIEGNLPAAARAARYRLIADWAAGRGIGAVALGHTRDDNVESFVMGLARGAGLDGLSGMRPRFRRGEVDFVRPLLEVSRTRLRDFLRAEEVAWIDDPSNEDASFDRVRIRRALAAAGVDHAPIAQSIGNLRRSRIGLDAVLADWAGRHLREDRGDLVVDPEAFAALPPELARRLLNAALRWVAAADYPPRAEPVLRLIAGGPPRRGQTLHGCLIRSEPRGLVIGREPEAAARAPAVPSDTLWDGRWRLEGPHRPGLQISALGPAGLKLCEGWRGGGLPRASLLASPALWQGGRLVAAPLAGRAAGWEARIVRSFAASLAVH